MPNLDNTDYNLIRPVLNFNLLNRMCSTRGRLILLFTIPSTLFFILISFTTQLNNGDTLVSVAFTPLRMARNIKEYETKLRGTEHPLRIMTFNIWGSGINVKDGLEKIAKHIAKVDPDIVALQEVRTLETAESLIEILGSSKWQYRQHPLAVYPDTAILTKHQFINDGQSLHLQFVVNRTIPPDYLLLNENKENNTKTNTTSSITTYGMGATIWLKDDDPNKQHLINFVSLHLDWRSYGPYAANNKLVNETAQIMAGECNKQGYGRAQNIEQLLNNDIFKRYMKNAEIQPLIVAGDFNTPSHLDWIEETRDIHGGWKFEWPATKLIMDAGLNDSFRALHPDPIKDPGITWSTVQKTSGPSWDWTIPEPQDRIDYIFYRPNEHFSPINSQIYSGEEVIKPMPEHYNNDWPSDHFAVISEFVINYSIEKKIDKEEIEENDNNSYEGEENNSSSSETANYL
jgi:endonuclease/exonuclease/phosphatase family metal-dependent hydrolase